MTNRRSNIHSLNRHFVLFHTLIIIVIILFASFSSFSNTSETLDDQPSAIISLGQLSTRSFMLTPNPCVLVDKGYIVNHRGQIMTLQANSGVRQNSTYSSSNSFSMYSSSADTLRSSPPPPLSRSHSSSSPFPHSSTM